jgi:hypothetical protein
MVILSFCKSNVFLYGDNQIGAHGGTHGTAQALIHFFYTGGMISLCVQKGFFQSNDLLGASQNTKSAALAKVGFERYSVHK